MEKEELLKLIDYIPNHLKQHVINFAYDLHSEQQVRRFLDVLQLVHDEAHDNGFINGQNNILESLNR